MYDFQLCAPIDVNIHHDELQSIENLSKGYARHVAYPLESVFMCATLIYDVDYE